MHTFSVIIPHHNIPQLLQRCLDSIPDVPDVQVIVVDDNSSADKVDFDHFPGLERRYTECIFDKQGGGAGHARNVGMQHADGKWLVFADADDFFTPDAFSILNRYKDEPYNIILFKANSVDSDNYTPSDRHFKLNNSIEGSLRGDISNVEAVLSMPVPWCKMFCREFILRNEISYDETPVANDMMFVAMAACLSTSARVAVCTDVLYVVTTRNGSLASGWYRNSDNYLMRLEVLIRYNKLLQAYPELRKEPLLIYLVRSLRLGVTTFLHAMCLLLQKGALFSGCSTVIKIINNHTLKL